MALTLLQIVQRAQSQLGLKFDTTAVLSAQDDTTMQMAALVQQLGEDLMTETAWTGLQKEFVINVEDPITKTATLTSGSAVVTVADTSDIAAYTWFVTGSGISSACRVESIDSSTQFTMTEYATLSGSEDLVLSKDTYAMPSDFRRYINDTWWDRTNHWKLVGPTSPQEFEWLESGIVSVGPRRRWRQIGVGPYFRLWPPPTATTDAPAALVFEYISTGWVLDTAGARKAAYTLDTDTCIYPDDVMVTGLKLKYFQAKLFDTTYLTRDYMQAMSRAVGADGGAGVLNMQRRRYPIFISPANVVDGNFPSTP